MTKQEIKALERKINRWAMQLGAADHGERLIIQLIRPDGSTQTIADYFLNGRGQATRDNLNNKNMTIRRY